MHQTPERNRLDDMNLATQHANTTISCVVLLTIWIHWLQGIYNMYNPHSTHPLMPTSLYGLCICLFSTNTLFPLLLLADFIFGKGSHRNEHLSSGDDMCYLSPHLCIYRCILSKHIHTYTYSHAIIYSHITVDPKMRCKCFGNRTRWRWISGYLCVWDWGKDQHCHYLMMCYVYSFKDVNSPGPISIARMEPDQSNTNTYKISTYIQAIRKSSPFSTWAPKATESLAFWWISILRSALGQAIYLELDLYMRLFLRSGPSLCVCVCVGLFGLFWAQPTIQWSHFWINK